MAYRIVVRVALIDDAGNTIRHSDYSKPVKAPAVHVYGTMPVAVGPEYEYSYAVQMFSMTAQKAGEMQRAAAGE